MLMLLVGAHTGTSDARRWLLDLNELAQHSRDACRWLWGLESTGAADAHDTRQLLLRVTGTSMFGYDW